MSWNEQLDRDPFRFHSMRGFPPSSPNHFFNRFFNETMRDFDRSFRYPPYWSEQSPHRGCTSGQVIGKVLDEKEKFCIEMDVAQFHPDELSVNVRNNEVIIEGHQTERKDEFGTIERHFIRKYLLPEDANAETLISELSDRGILRISTMKKTSDHENVRSVPIRPVSHNNEKI